MFTWNSLSTTTTFEHDIWHMVRLVSPWELLMSSLFLLSSNQQSLLEIRKDQHAIGSSAVTYKYHYTQNQIK